MSPISGSNVSFGVLHFINSNEHSKDDSVKGLEDWSDANSFKSIKNMLTHISQLPEDIYVKITPAHTSSRHGVYMDLYTDSDGKDNLMNLAYQKDATQDEHAVWDSNNYKKLESKLKDLKDKNEKLELIAFIRRFCAQFKP